jgi:hypothetical protein
MTRQPDLMTDAELDALLAHASAPPLPLGARERLLARVAAETEPRSGATNVVPLRRHARPHPRIGWLAGLPLAASLALGIYLGNAGGLDAYLPGTAYEMLAGASTDDAVSGIEDIEGFSEDDLS